MLYIVNESLKSGVFPSEYKKAVVKPTFKGHGVDRDSKASYRPVSNLSFMSELLEKVANIQFGEHLDDQNLHCPDQSGYRPKHSCETLMVRMFDDILSGMEQKNTIVLLLLDLSAAFDTIDHDLLLKKLSSKKITWLKVLPSPGLPPIWRTDPLQLPSMVKTQAQVSCGTVFPKGQYSAQSFSSYTQNTWAR